MVHGPSRLHGRTDTVLMMMMHLSSLGGWATNCFFHVRDPCDACLVFSGGCAGVSAC